MENTDLLKRVKTARLVKGINQEEIAKELNVSIPTYSRFERGITKTDFSILQKVCKYLEIDIYKSFDFVESLTLQMPSIKQSILL